MTLRYHGLRLLSPDSGELRFGIAQLIGACQGWRWSGNQDVPPLLKVTLRRFQNRKYWQCAAKCKDTVHKLDKAVCYLGRGMDAFERNDEFAFDGAPMEKAGKFFRAADDLPYHLDSLLAYLRILADCVAFAIPFFYRTRESVAQVSFRKHRDWFQNKRPEFDHTYTSVLREETSWFDKLAGKEPKGVRDLHFHQFATYQLGTVEDPTGKRTISVQQVTSRGITDPELTFTLTAIIADFFVYLDSVYTVFSDRLAEECAHLTSGSLEERSVFMRYTGCPDLRKRYRLYPLIETEEDADRSGPPDK